MSAQHLSTANSDSSTDPAASVLKARYTERQHPLICSGISMTTLTPVAFVQKWRQAAIKERSGYQEHFIDLCRLIGHPTPIEADPLGTFFAFEAGADKQRGGQGWADVWKRGHFAWEYKGKNANLDRAYQQILQYRESLENPPLLVVSDMDQIVIHTNFTNTVKLTVTITLDDLLTPAGLQRLRDVFERPDAFRAAETPQQVTEQAAAEFARLAALLRQTYADPQQIAHFLIRLLFCLFAEDIGLLPNNLFSRLIESTRRRPALFSTQLRQLFEAMAHGGFFAMEDIPHINGRLFDDAAVLELDQDALDLLFNVSRLDWANIEPSIVGTLFERSLDPAKRAQLGAHYTSRDDILLIVEPVLMAPLRRRWADVAAHAGELAAQRDAAPAAQRTRLQNELQQLLTGFAAEIAAVTVLDPACGSGNFLYMALKQLLDLEKSVITRAQSLAAGGFFPSVSPEQLFGIEVNPYAHELAQLTVWIGYLQWLRDNGYGTPQQPILRSLNTIQRGDAILTVAADGSVSEPDWPAAAVIVGNPPFLGDKKMRGELGNTYVETLRRLYDGRVPGGADLVTYWFEKARAMLEQGRAQRVGLLATQAIRGGANRRVLERIKQSGDIFMAWSDRKWILDGAAVQTSIVGFDGGNEKLRSLDGIPVDAISANLSDRLDAAQAQRLTENKGLAFLGVMKAGPFDVDVNTARQMLAQPINPNGRPNSDVIKPRVNGQDITRRPSGGWLIDFGTDTSEDDASLYTLPFEYVRQHVLPIRAANRRTKMREQWWIHGESRPGLRNAIATLRRYIVTPTLSKHRLFIWLSHPTLPDHQTVTIARDDDYFFGVLHSRFHELWARALGTQLREAESGFRYTPSSTFETFPLPWTPGREPQDDARVTAIAAAAAQLNQLRGNWLNPPGASEAELKKRTLTNLYNQRPTWLANAHARLDAAVAAAYGWPADLSDEQVLARLLALNLERAAAQGAAAAAPLELAADEDAE
jgi:type II restriction/modification system DNA methylase subunit YeeA